MRIFTKETTFFEVLQSVAGEQFALCVGEVLEVSGAVPIELEDYERAGLVRRLPDPGALLPWLRVVAHIRSVSAATFVTRPDPPTSSYLDEAALLRRLGWSAEDLASARARLGFPPPARKRTRFKDGHGFETLAVFWDETEIANWQRNRPAPHLLGA
jgi:hypothetical protein